MKKGITLALVSMLALSLTACGGNKSNNNTPPPPVTQNETPAEPAPPPVTDTSGGTDTQPDPTPSDPMPDIPDNGTPPNAPAPFETHPGDKGYFFVDTDDYAVFMYDISDEVKNVAYAFAPCVQYTVISFDGTDYTKMFHKWVFDSAADAAAFAATESHRLAIENVVYNDYDDSLPSAAYDGIGKEYHIRMRYGRTVWEHGGNVYLSVPDGFEELLADSGQKGKTGYMTMREAFADAGFTVLPDTSELDFDVTNFIITFSRDNNYNSFDANFMVFDGETGVLSGRIFFYDDPAKEPYYDGFASPPDRTKSYYLEYLPGQVRAGGNIAYVGL